MVMDRKRENMLYENTPTIKTERLILRKFTAADTPDLYELLSDIEVNTFLPWFPVKHSEEAQTFLQERFLQYYEKPSAYRYAICLSGDNGAIGYVWLSDGPSYDFGYALKKEFWHRGIVSEAAKAVVERIKNAGYPYITATHDTKNPRSGEVMKRLGMQYRYSYVEQWQPKNLEVTFRLYQMNFDGKKDRVYREYWNRYENHFVEDITL